MLDRADIDALFPADLPEPGHWEERYPPRGLPEGALVTRFSPSPTGSAHIGGIYVAVINKAMSRQSGGRYIVRIEDTDQAREVEGAIAQFDQAFGYFGVRPDETDDDGGYGPYVQSRRAEIYQSYVRQLLREDKAYLCFDTREELAAAAAAQRAAKVPTGYYGRWATWRDASPEDVRRRLAAGEPYVVRFRSPGQVGGRVHFVDGVRGRLEAEDNRNDIVILKSSEQAVRLPTYHLAHAVDDHLMRVSLVIRGDEWISSVPVHLQLFDALGFERIPYAHIAPLMKQDGGGKRKLSKRKDPEAAVDFYITTGYPAEAVLYYLRGLANGRLAEMPLDAALAEPVRLDELGVAGPLVDLVKLEDISADLIAGMPGEQIADQVLAWARDHDPELVPPLTGERDMALRALRIEREGVANPRKDLRKWSDFRPVYGYFFTSLFQPVTDPRDERLGGLDPQIVQRFCADVLKNYRETDDADAWFDQIRVAAAEHGFAPSAKEYKKNPELHPGSIREASQVIRVLLTGSTRSPALHLVAGALGPDEVRRRIQAVTG
jgi:glutamyl-tRNA synthetase